ncbi:MAG TPA: DUF5954 family protein [Streptosporangiaceae bacterium]|jgi:hypothetical protein
MTGSDGAEDEARRALDAYPRMMTAGVEFTCMEEVDRRWRIISAAHHHPQDGRDALAHHFRVLAGQTSDPELFGRLEAAYEILDRETANELLMDGHRYRVGRLEKFVRVGADGPETPRASDPESPIGVGGKLDRRALGFLNANALGGTAAAIVRYVMRNKALAPATPEMERDAVRALETHPKLVLLPADYMIAEEVDGDWRSAGWGLAATPQAARDALTDYFRVVIPGPDSTDPAAARAAVIMKRASPGADVCARYRRAADDLDRHRLDDIRVEGRHYRVVRVEQAVRLGSDGPEPPRPSDTDPYGPPAAS